MLDPTNWPPTIAALGNNLAVAQAATRPYQVYSSPAATKSEFYGGVIGSEVNNICATKSQMQFSLHMSAWPWIQRARLSSQNEPTLPR
jgi:hypothetical protein